MLKHRPGRQTWIWPSEAVFIRQNNYPLYPGHPFRTQLLRAGARMLCEKDRKRDSDTEQRIHYFDGVLPFPVIQSFGKNVLWEKRESAIWHKAKNLLPWWRFTVFLTVAADSSLICIMTPSALSVLWLLPFAEERGSLKFKIFSPRLLTRKSLFAKIITIFKSADGKK